jgi:hypothetical protein
MSAPGRRVGEGGGEAADAAPAPAAWFSVLGTPLAPAQQSAIAAMLEAGAGPGGGGGIVVIGDWPQLAQALHRFDRDDRWWDREEEEREELWALASARHTEEELQAAIAAATDAARDDIRSALAAALPTGAFADPRLSEAALAAALLAVHHRVLALLADAPQGHPFFGKHALFAAGRWPLGCLDGRYHVF